MLLSLAGVSIKSIFHNFSVDVRPPMLDWCDTSAVNFSWASMNLKCFFILYDKAYSSNFTLKNILHYLYILQPKAVLQQEKTRDYYPVL